MRLLILTILLITSWSTLAMEPRTDNTFQLREGEAPPEANLEGGIEIARSQGIRSSERHAATNKGGDQRAEMNKKNGPATKPLIGFGCGIHGGLQTSRQTLGKCADPNRLAKTLVWTRNDYCQSPNQKGTT